ncbi:MAG: hypothetical protein HRT98_04505 [Mycoplasmatales bacterium]|nr:hypothetical protein [Mycoplasmatales bacterium]
MNKNKKIWLGALSMSIPIASIIVSTSFSTTKEAPKVYFQGRMFNTVNEALNYLIQNEKIRFKNHRVLGDIERSYINSESGLLNKSLLPDYDPSKIHFAYRNAGGGLTPNYNRAKETYYNPGTVVSVYSDGYGHDNFLSEKEAEESMRKNSMSSKIGIYNVEYLSMDSNDDLVSIPKNLNPFNISDINDFKENIKNNIFGIIRQNIKKPNNSNYKITNFVSNDSIKSKETKTGAGVLNLLKQKIRDWNGWNIKSENGIDFLTKKISEKESKTVNLESDWRGIGTWRMNDSREGKWGDLGFRVQNYGKRWNWNSTSTSFNNSDDLENFINAKNVSLLTMTKTGNASINDTQKRMNEIDGIKSKIKNIISNMNSLKTSNQNNVFYKNELIKNTILEKVHAENQIFHQIDRASFKNDFFQLTKLPDFDIDTQKYYGWKTWNEVKIENKKYTFEYQRTIKIPLKEISIDNNKSKLLSDLLKWKDPNKKATFTIQKDGHKLFDVELGVSSEKIKVNKITLNPENHKGALVIPSAKEITQFENNELPSDDAGIQKWFYWMLQELHKDLNVGGAERKSADEIATIFKKYFGDEEKYFGKAFKEDKDGNYRFDLGFYENKLYQNVSLDVNESLKLYLNLINAAYKKYNALPKLLKEITKKIINPNDIFIQGEIINQKFYSEIKLGKYMIKSINDFNAPVSKGFFSNNTSIALNEGQWNTLKQKTKFIPAHLLIAYDTNGKKSNVGDYNNDSQLLLQFNILLNKEPRRDFSHVFIGGSKINGSFEGAKLVDNIITTIHSVKIENTDYYFKTFEQLKGFMLKYIEKNSIRV